MNVFRDVIFVKSTKCGDCNLLCFNYLRRSEISTEIKVIPEKLKFAVFQALFIFQPFFEDNFKDQILYPDHALNYNDMMRSNKFYLKNKYKKDWPQKQYITPCLLL